jgi:hypothetical protein
MSIGRAGSMVYQKAYSGNRSFGHKWDGEDLPARGSSEKTAGTVFGWTYRTDDPYFNNPCLYPSLTA